MKMMYAGLSESPNAVPENWLYNCTRNKSCEKKFYIPISSLGDLQLYFDLPFKPNSYELNLITCTGAVYPLFFCNYIIGQKPGNSWYGIFAASSSGVTLPGISFYIKGEFFNAAGVGVTYFSNEIIIDTCAAISKVSSCYNDTQSEFAFDCNGIYYGYHAGNAGASLGNELLRYYHSAYVRFPNLYEEKNKMNFTLFNSRSAYKNYFYRNFIFEFELVPTFYKNILIGVFNRGNIEVNGSAYTLDEQQEIGLANGTQFLWKCDVLLTELCKQSFSCTPTICTPAPPVCDDNFKHAVYSPGSNTMNLSGGLVVEPDLINWQLLLDDVILDSGQTFGHIIPFEPDLDLETNCYVFKWQKVCNCGGHTGFKQSQFGNCEGCCDPVFLTGEAQTIPEPDCCNPVVSSATAETIPVEG